MGSATADLKMRKRQYTVDGVGQGGAPLRCAQAAVWITENQGTGPGQKSQQGDDISHPDQLIPGQEEVISLGNTGAVCQPTVLRPLSRSRRDIPRAK